MNVMLVSNRSAQCGFVSGIAFPESRRPAPHRQHCVQVRMYLYELIYFFLVRKVVQMYPSVRH